MFDTCYASFEGLLGHGVYACVAFVAPRRGTPRTHVPTYFASLATFLKRAVKQHTALFSFLAFLKNDLQPSTILRHGFGADLVDIAAPGRNSSNGFYFGHVVLTLETETKPWVDVVSIESQVPKVM